MDNQKKNIIIISDQKGSCIDSLIDTNLFFIKMVIVPYKNNVEYLKEKYGNKIESYLYYIPDNNSEFQEEFASDYSLTYEEIEKFRGTQLKCYRYNSRFITNDNDNNCIYYTALKYFLNYFSNNTIDCVFSRIMEHGSISDSVVFDVAKHFNVPVFMLSTYTQIGYKNMLSLIDYNNKTFVDISSINKGNVEFKELLSTLNKDYSSNNLLKLPFSKLLSKFFKKKDRTFSKCFKWFYEYKIKHYYSNFKVTSKNDLFKMREETSFKQMLSGHFYFKKIKKFYKKHSINTIEDENFLFYPLHLEPEASIMARTTLNCQQFIIEQVARMLPPNYTLYVKEHPDQFLMVQIDKYMHKSVRNYRNIDFYRRISNIKNVKLVSIFTPSSQLIDKSKGVISITGSVLMESIAKNKPVIVFGNHCSFVELLKDTFNITEFNNVKDAIDKIQNGFAPDYSDFDSIINKYVFSFDDKNFYCSNDIIMSVFKLLYMIISK